MTFEGQARGRLGHRFFHAKRVAEFLAYNPMAPIVQACQSILVNQQWPRWQTLWPMTLLAVLLCGLGFRLFRRRAGEMVDEL